MSTTTYEDKINQMYDSQLNSQKEQLTQDYTKADSDLTAQKDKLQKQTDAQLRRTAVDAQKAKINTAEYHAANGLSTGARAQARLALENQLQADLAALRTAQQEADSETERQRGLLSQEYAALIRKAQADNDFQRAQALYQEAKDADAKLLARQEAAAGIMAQAGDYTRYGELYGLTPEEIKKLRKQSSGGGTRRVIDNDILDVDPVVEEEGDEVAVTPQSPYIQAVKDQVLGLLNPIPVDTTGTKATDTADAFIKRHMSLEEAIGRGIGETSFKAMIRKDLEKANLSAADFAKLEQIYGLA